MVRRLLKDMDMGDMIICDNLKKVYPGKNGNPDKHAVRGLSLALRKGQCFGMLGPNGAGKTSFINMVIYSFLPAMEMLLLLLLHIASLWNACADDWPRETDVWNCVRAWNGSEDRDERNIHEYRCMSTARVRHFVISGDMMLLFSRKQVRRGFAMLTCMCILRACSLLWEPLTGREHLMFYGRMKNLTGAALTQVVCLTELRSTKPWMN